MKKKVFFIPVALMGMTLVACGGSNPEPTPETYNVTCATEGVTLTNTKATKGEDYITSIELSKEKIKEKLVLPQQLEEVIVGGNILKEYEYNLSDNKQKADFKISKESVLGDIEIKLTLVAPETYIVTCKTEGVTLTSTLATKGEDYETSIVLSEEKIKEEVTLPEALTEVTIGGKETKNYTYTPDKEMHNADFKISSDYVIGDIEIKLILVTPEPRTFTAKLEGSEVMELSKTSATEGTDYNASISILDSYKKYCTVPAELTEVKIGDYPLKEYTYSVDKDGKGQLTIAGKDVIGNIVITAKAVGNTVSVNVSDEKITADKNEATVGSSFSTTLKILDDNYSFPEALGEYDIKEKVDGKDDFNLTKYCNYTKVDKHTATLNIPATYGETKEILIWDDITVNIKSIEDKVTIEDGTLVHLKTDIGTGRSIPKNKNFAFNLEVSNAINATYVLPDSLKIYVGGSTTALDRSGYDISPEGKTSKTKATVTIFAKSVTGNIVVSGEAKEEATKYEVTLVGYEVDIKGDSTATENEQYQAKIAAEEGHELPTEDNVRVYIGDLDDIKVNDWYIPNDKEYSGGITYTHDGDAGILTIPGDIITNTIVIVSCAPDVSLLEELSWEEIGAISDAGYAPYLFEVGEETKAFKIDGYEEEFKARILDFNRDAKEGEKKNPAGMTLEFTSCIKKVCFSSAECNDQNTYYYKDFYDKIYTSDMYNILNNEIYSKLPFKNQIKQVEKATLKGTKGGSDHSSEIQSSPNYLFPLSLKEMDAIPERWMSAYEDEVPYFKPEGAVYANQPYAYYKGRTQTVPNILRKKLGKEYANYWLRSPATDIRTPNIYGYVNSSDKMSQFNCRMTNSAIAPAFCI